MLKEFVETLAGYVTKSERVSVHEVEGIKHRRIVTQGIGYEWVDLDIPDRNATLNSLSAFVDYVEVVCAETSEVFVSPEGVTIISDSERCEVADMSLTHTDQFSILSEMANGRSPSFSFLPPDLIRFLRTQLPNGTESLVAAARKVDFSRRDDGSFMATSTSEGMGRSIEMEVKSSVEIPDQVTVTTPVYEQAGLESIQVSIPVIVQKDFESKQLVLSVASNTIGPALNVAQERLKNLLRESTKKPRLIVCGRVEMGAYDE